MQTKCEKIPVIYKLMHVGLLYARIMLFFTFIVVRFFVRGGVGGGPRDGQKIGKNCLRGPREIKFGNHCPKPDSMVPSY